MRIMRRAKIDSLSHPLRIVWQEPPIGRLLQGATPLHAKTLISRLFTLCAQAHSAAASLLLFPEEAPDMQAAQQELARETLRRALTDWLPQFSHRQATAEEWTLLRHGDLSLLADKLFLTMILKPGLPLAYQAGKPGFCEHALTLSAG